MAPPLAGGFVLLFPVLFDHIITPDQYPFECKLSHRLSPQTSDEPCRVASTQPYGTLQEEHATAPASVALPGHLGAITGACRTDTGGLVTCDSYGTTIVWGDAAAAPHTGITGSSGTAHGLLTDIACQAGSSSRSGGGRVTMGGQRGQNTVGISGGGGGEVRRLKQHSEPFAPVSPRLGEPRPMRLPHQVLSEPLQAGRAIRATGIGRCGGPRTEGSGHPGAGGVTGGIGRRHDGAAAVAVGEGGVTDSTRPKDWPVARLTFGSPQEADVASQGGRGTSRTTHYGKQPEVRA